MLRGSPDKGLHLLLDRRHQTEGRLVMSHGGPQSRRSRNSSRTQSTRLPMPRQSLTSQSKSLSPSLSHQSRLHSASLPSWWLPISKGDHRLLYAQYLFFTLAKPGARQSELHYDPMAREVGNDRFPSRPARVLSKEPPRAPGRIAIACPTCPRPPSHQIRPPPPGA